MSNSHWDEYDLNGFNKETELNCGQISLNSFLGNFLFECALNTDIETFLEVGTWNGLGSTKCFVEGFLKRSTPFKFYSLECNKEKVEIAKNHYKNMDNIFILNEVLLNEQPKEIYEIFPILLENEKYTYWNKIDFDNMKDKKLFLDRIDIPEIFDLIFLDGGEFTTWFEYNIIKDRCKMLVLDDTNVFKCQKIVEDIKTSNKWTIIFENNERNGSLICKRKNM
jgi:hypothetical protein